MLRKLTVACLAVLGAAVPASAAAELVTNGGFEADAAGGTLQSWGYYAGITGWTVPSGLTWYYPNVTEAQLNNVTAQIYGPLNGHANGLTASAQGGAFMALDGDSSFPGVMTQQINGLTAGGKYKVSFEWAGAQQRFFPGATADKYLTVSLGSQSFDTGPQLAGPEASFQPWRSASFTFTAASASETLKFLAHGTPNGQPPFVLLDSVSLQSAVPEPATWAMLVLGFGLVGSAMRRRARATTVAA